jgi:hypothetical protein
MELYGPPTWYSRFYADTNAALIQHSNSHSTLQICAIGHHRLNILFSGFNSTLRRGNVTHHEYIQVGKGRDVGLNQISLFEAKVACGNGEQVLSRDIYRLGHRFDFFRMLSCYFTTVGFYVSSMVQNICIHHLCLDLSSCMFLMFWFHCFADGCHNSLCFLVWKTLFSIKWTWVCNYEASTDER